MHLLPDNSFSTDCKLEVIDEPATPAFLSLLLLSAGCCAWCHRSHRFLCRFMWRPIPSPVAAGTSGGSLSELTSMMMFLQLLTWQTIANRNEPPATESRVSCSTISPGASHKRRSYCHQQDNDANHKAAHGSMQSLCHHWAHPLSSGISLIARVFFSLACMNQMKQSRGININAVITALGASQNQDNSRRLASRKQKKILITLAAAFFPNGRHAAACHLSLESVQTYLCCCCSFLQAQRAGFKLNRRAPYSSPMMCLWGMWWNSYFFVMYFMSCGALVWKFSSSPKCSINSPAKCSPLSFKFKPSAG